jgi:hypothetical protein
MQDDVGSSILPMLAIVPQADEWNIISPFEVGELAKAGFLANRMPHLITLNRDCSDCSDLTVSFVALHHCVFLCSDCTTEHKDLSYPLRPLTSHFDHKLLQLTQH